MQKCLLFIFLISQWAIPVWSQRNSGEIALFIAKPTVTLDTTHLSLVLTRAYSPQFGQGHGPAEYCFYIYGFQPVPKPAISRPMLRQVIKLHSRDEEHVSRFDATHRTRPDYDYSSRNDRHQNAHQTDHLSEMNNEQLLVQLPIAMGTLPLPDSTYIVTVFPLLTERHCPYRSGEDVWSTSLRPVMVAVKTQSPQNQGDMLAGLYETWKVQLRLQLIQRPKRSTAWGGKATTLTTISVIQDLVLILQLPPSRISAPDAILIKRTADQYVDIFFHILPPTRNTPFDEQEAEDIAITHPMGANGFSPPSATTRKPLLHDRRRQPPKYADTSPPSTTVDWLLSNFEFARLVYKMAESSFKQKKIDKNAHAWSSRNSEYGQQHTYPQHQQQQPDYSRPRFQQRDPDAYKWQIDRFSLRPPIRASSRRSAGQIVMQLQSMIKTPNSAIYTDTAALWRCDPSWKIPALHKAEFEVPIYLFTAGKVFVGAVVTALIVRQLWKFQMTMKRFLILLFLLPIFLSLFSEAYGTVYKDRQEFLQQQMHCSHRYEINGCWDPRPDLATKCHEWRTCIDENYWLGRGLKLFQIGDVIKNVTLYLDNLWISLSWKTSILVFFLFLGLIYFAVNALRQAISWGRPATETDAISRFFEFLKQTIPSQYQQHRRRPVQSQSPDAKSDTRTDRTSRTGRTDRAERRKTRSQTQKNSDDNDSSTSRRRHRQRERDKKQRGDTSLDRLRDLHIQQLHRASRAIRASATGMGGMGAFHDPNMNTTTNPMIHPLQMLPHHPHAIYHPPGSYYPGPGTTHPYYQGQYLPPGPGPYTGAVAPPPLGPAAPPLHPPAPSSVPSPPSETPGPQPPSLPPLPKRSSPRRSHQLLNPPGELEQQEEEDAANNTLTRDRRRRSRPRLLFRRSRSRRTTASTTLPVLRTTATTTRSRLRREGNAQTRQMTRNFAAMNVSGTQQPSVESRSRATKRTGGGVRRSLQTSLNAQSLHREGNEDEAAGPRLRSSTTRNAAQTTPGND